MPVGMTNKTEYQRYLNEYPTADKSLLLLLNTYQSNPHQKHMFGAWMRFKHPATFHQSYLNFWLKHPKLFGKIYEGCEAVPN